MKTKGYFNYIISILVILILSLSLGFYNNPILEAANESSYQGEKDEKIKENIPNQPDIDIKKRMPNLKNDMEDVIKDMENVINSKVLSSLQELEKVKQDIFEGKEVKYGQLADSKGSSADNKIKIVSKTGNDSSRKGLDISAPDNSKIDDLADISSRIFDLGKKSLISGGNAYLSTYIGLVKNPKDTSKDLARVAIGFSGGGDILQDGYELVVGKTIFGDPLSKGERIAAGVSLGLPIALGPIIKGVKNINKIKNYKFKKPPSCKISGIAPNHHKELLKHAKENDAVIMVRNSTLPSYHPDIKFKEVIGKGMEIPVKTCKKGKYKGYVLADPNDPNVIKALKDKNKDLTYDQWLKDINKKGYKVHPEHDYMLTQNGKAVISDYDLHGYYKPHKKGKYKYSHIDEENLGVQSDLLNNAFGSSRIRHPSHDLWAENHIFGPNAGVLPPITAYTKDGAYYIQTVKELKKFNIMHGIKPNTPTILSKNYCNSLKQNKAGLVPTSRDTKHLPKDIQEKLKLIDKHNCSRVDLSSLSKRKPGDVKKIKIFPDTKDEYVLRKYLNKWTDN